MFSLWMIVLLIVRLLRGYLGSLLVKVLTHSLSFVSLCLVSGSVSDLKKYGIYTVTTVESGTRALQYLGLDGDKGSSGLKVMFSIFLSSNLSVF